MKRIGLLGGTFDPPHMGHLLIAEEVFQSLQLDEVWFIPSYQPPHKEKAQTEADHRVNMVKLATEDNDHFQLNTIEVNRQGLSYTLDTIKVLKDEHPSYEFYFIIGADMVEYLPKWQKINELLELVPFVGVKRKGFELKTPYSIIEVEIPLFEVSSSMLRSRLQKGDSTRYLVPEKVESYIREHKLYGCK